MTPFGITGASGSGKTTLVTALLPVLRCRGLRVSTIKHAHHGFDMDTPGKDSWLHREAGAEEVMVAGPDRWALLRETRQSADIDLAFLLARMTPVDLVLVEGFRQSTIAMLEVFRPGLGKPPYYPSNLHIVAVATDAPALVPDRTCLPLSDSDAIADFILRRISR